MIAADRFKRLQEKLVLQPYQGCLEFLSRSFCTLLRQIFFLPFINLAAVNFRLLIVSNPD